VCLITLCTCPCSVPEVFLQNDDCHSDVHTHMHIRTLHTCTHMYTHTHKHIPCTYIPLNTYKHTCTHEHNSHTHYTQHNHSHPPHIHPPTHTHTLGQGFYIVTHNILSYLDDARSLCRAEQVCNDWYQVIAKELLWKKLIQRTVKTDSVWRGLSERRGW